MMKLNDKGFAVSTILYGILTLTIIILMLIFGVMKSNKDMNQDLASSIEEDINKCTLSEIELENCYFSNGVCDTKEYYSCIDKKEEYKLLYDEVELGDFVNYDAGTWPVTVPMPDGNENFVFGGYTAGVSRNNSINSNLFNGWRVMYKTEDAVVLVHAGIPEYFYFDVTDVNTIYNYTNIMYGDDSSVLSKVNKNYNYTTRVWDDYLNPDYADDARIMSAYDSDLLFNQSSYCTDFTCDVLYMEEDYSLGEVVNDNSVSIFDYLSSYISTTTKGTYGIRPVIHLKKDIKTSGYVTNTYGFKEWILEK